MARSYDLIPRAVPRVETALRRIVTDFPVPESIPILEQLAAFEPAAMQGQPPVVWDSALNTTVKDKWGNQWIDWSSGVLITNAGHGRPEIVDAIVKQAQHGLLTNYCFPNEVRANFVKRLSDLMPEPHKKVFLLTVGSETVECAIKLSRAHGVKVGGPSKNVIVSYEKAFHGRTLGSQQAGGIPVLKEWIVNLDPGFVQVPFPDGFRTEDTSFEFFEKCLADKGVTPAEVAGVLMETYQGGSASFAPVAYMQRMRQWCDQHQILLTCDEVQAGFGRTGKFSGFEHYGIVPDLSTWGKGISSSLPIACIIGSREVMDLFPPGSAAAALASLDLILNENLAENARIMGDRMLAHFRAMQAKYPQIGWVDGKGLVAGLACVKPGTKNPDPDLAWDAIRASIERGVLMFSPVGFGGATIKVCPPLNITQEAVDESLAVFEEAFVSCL